MSAPITIAVDAMGGDHGAEVIVPAALDVLSRAHGLHLVLIGQEEALQAELARHKAAPGERLSLQAASQVVGMSELPSQALRTKKDSSMRVAVDLVKAGRAHACVSAGNTGALMATARYVLKTLPGIDRPAIITAIPSIEGHFHMLDLGGNVECTVEHLFEFAVMGAVLVRAVDGIERPRVALLNVGEEEIKGNYRVREAARLMAESDLNYVGYVEGDVMYRGGADVVVCDGFTGNVALKTIEGVARLVGHYVKEEFGRNLPTRLAGLAALPVLKTLRKKTDPRQYNGASLLGLNGIVIKSHGSADAVAFANAIKIARIEVEKGIAQTSRQQLEAFLAERQAI
ncbi:MAG: phosphate acyltransferase PlsX [Gammaproteobacteria bacterium]|nr:phosphate acyltransferase PlsX [Gammaproteobacteria bacterium]